MKYIEMSSLLFNKKKGHYRPLRNLMLTTRNNNILMAQKYDFKGQL